MLLVAAWLSTGTPMAWALPQSCSVKSDPRSPAYQQRDQMLRCEGERPRPIAATGLWLASFTIGNPSVRRSQDGGEEILLRVPMAAEAGGSTPEVVVQARRRNYQMQPLRFRTGRNKWSEFAWGVAVLDNLRIDPRQLRALATLNRAGEATEQLPVWFAEAESYTLVLDSNMPLRLRTFQVRAANGSRVMDLLKQDRTSPVRRWNARQLPAGVYTIEARADDEFARPLVVTVRHDPRWLGR
jgi:hypothetical protein